MFNWFVKKLLTFFEFLNVLWVPACLSYVLADIILVAVFESTEIWFTFVHSG